MNELGRFVKWGENVSLDLTKKVIKLLPMSQPEELVEIPTEKAESDEDLKARVSSL